MGSGSLVADERRAASEMRRRWLRVWLTAAFGTLLLHVFVTAWFVMTIHADNGVDVHVARFIAYGTTGTLTYRLVVEWRRRQHIQRLWTLWSLIRDRISTMRHGVVYRNIITGYCVIRTPSRAMTEIIGIVAERDIHEVLAWAMSANYHESDDDDDQSYPVTFDHALTTLTAYRIWTQTPTSHIVRTIIPVRLDDRVWKRVRLSAELTRFRRLMSTLRRLRALNRLGLLYADEVELRGVLESVHGAVPFNPPGENATSAR